MLDESSPGASVTMEAVFKLAVGHFTHLMGGSA